MDEQPETEAGPANDETEVVANAAEAQQEWQAWSNPETGSQPVVDYVAEPRWRSLLRKVLAAAAAVAIGAIAAVILMPDHHQPPFPKAVPPTFHESTGPTTVAVQAVPPPSTAPTVRTALPGCYHSHPVEEKPTTSDTECRMHSYENLTWTSWTSTSADGTGIQLLQNCTPSCAEGQLWRTPVEVHFSGSAPAPADSGCPPDMQYYTQLIAAYPTTHPPPETALSYQGHAVYMQYNGMPAYRWDSLSPRCNPSDN